MKNDRFSKFIISVASGMGLVLAICIIIAAGISLFSLSKYLVILFKADPLDVYKTIKNFLAIALLLTISIELVLMILSHSMHNVLELVMFAVARKMLVYSDTMMDILIGTIAIAIVFGVKKYLTSSEKFMDTLKNLKKNNPPA
jgi:hypothetical protein